MAYIDILQKDLPGIVGLFSFRPAMARPLCELAEILLRGESSLTPGEREIIASYVSYKNDCHYCHTSHGAAAAHHYGGNLDLIDDIKQGLVNTPVSPKLRALLNIAAKVQQGGKHVKQEDIDKAVAEGATDREIHDTVLIAAAFCMYNRYVDGLNTWTPKEKEAFDGIGEGMAKQGYLRHFKNDGDIKYQSAEKKQ